MSNPTMGAYATALLALVVACVMTLTHHPVPQEVWDLAFAGGGAGLMGTNPSPPTTTTPAAPVPAPAQAGAPPPATP